MAWVENVTRDRVLGQQVEVAHGFLRRFRGLIGRKHWGNLDGLWIEPCAGVHAFGMGFTIDVILVDEGRRVLWTQTLRPWRVGKVHLDAHSALEIPLGTLEKTGTRKGDQLALHMTKPDTMRAS